MHRQMKKENKYLTVNKVSEKFDIGKALIYYWIRIGAIAYFKHQKRILIPENSLIEFLENHTVDKR